MRRTLYHHQWCHLHYTRQATNHITLKFPGPPCTCTGAEAHTSRYCSRTLFRVHLDSNQLLVRSPRPACIPAIQDWTTAISVTHEDLTELIMSAHGAHQLHSQHGLPIRTAHVVGGLLALRLINTACTDRTFFQPDEYFQALEPAWNLAFGPNSGAWLTWVGLLSWGFPRLLV